MKNFKINLIVFILVLLFIQIVYFTLITLVSLKSSPINNFDYDSIRNEENPSQKYPKWIVVTSINNPSKQLEILSKLNKFKLVVVGDAKTNQNWHLDNAIFLSLSKQNGLNYNIWQTTPYNSYTRKNIGYLYAIKNGAEFIYDTDDDNVPVKDLDSYFSFNKTEYGLVLDCESPSIINPYAHFGQPQIWPRGFPLTRVQDNFYNGYFGGVRKSSIVQQGVVNGDPDVDAIFRLTRSMRYKKLDVKFDATAPSVQLPIGKLSPFNSQNTLFHYEAFWMLYLPKTVSFRLTGIYVFIILIRMNKLISGLG